MGFIGNQGFGGVSYTNLGTVKGKVADSDALDAVTGMSNGDLYLQEDNGHANIYDGSAWIDLGSLVGPTGAIGPTGPAGIDGADGVPGVIDHITKTNGDTGSGTTVTYTAYADADETQSLGTFDVYNGTDGAGALDSIVAGTNITIDNTDAANPVISSTGGGSEHYDQEDTPTPSSTGATWYKPSTGVLYKYVNDGTNDIWVDISTAGAGGTTWNEVYTATGGETLITIPNGSTYTVGADELVVAIEGVVQFLEDDYTETSETEITVATEMTADERISIQKV